MYPLIQLKSHYPIVNEWNIRYINYLLLMYPDDYYFKPVNATSFYLLNKRKKNMPRNSSLVDFETSISL